MLSLSHQVLLHSDVFLLALTDNSREDLSTSFISVPRGEKKKDNSKEKKNLLFLTFNFGIPSLPQGFCFLTSHPIKGSGL